MPMCTPSPITQALTPMPEPGEHSCARGEGGPREGRGTSQRGVQQAALHVEKGLPQTAVPAGAVQRVRRGGPSEAA